MRFVKLVAGSVCVAALAACTPEAGDRDPGAAVVSPTPHEGGTVHVGIVGEPATLDPYGPAASDHSYALVRPVFPMPFRLLPDGSVEPDLAERVVVEGRTARLFLRRARWSDGSRITARDVVISIRRATPPSGLARIRSARVVSDRVVRVRGDVDDWEEALASGAYVLPGGRLRGGTLSGGPFRFAHYQPGRRLVFEPNKRWPGTPPLLDRVVVDFVQSTELLIRLLEEGRLDAAVVPSTVNLDERLDELELHYGRALGWESVALEFDDPVAADEWIATASGIDRERLLSSFVRDEGRLSNTLSPGPLGTEGFWSHVAIDAGAPPPEITIGAPEGDELLTLMQRAIQLDLERSGVTAELVTAPWATYYGVWPEDGPADAYLVRRAGAPGAATPPDAVGSSALPLAHVETFVAWNDTVHGAVVHPALDGPLWNAEEWWKDPSI
ncbi:MAG TPA: ABC transporter substrate-binding protein [Actinomycetota bacterium]|nr:ABC transporter substrate-binding protein [Actinomycetota bacterium]